jgi:hypothetical protein
VSGATNEFDYRDSPSIIHILPGASVTPQAKQVAQPNLPCCDAACETTTTTTVSATSTTTSTAPVTTTTTVPTILGVVSGAASEIDVAAANQ